MGLIAAIGRVVRERLSTDDPIMECPNGHAVTAREVETGYAGKGPGYCVYCGEDVFPTKTFQENQ